MYGIIYNGMFNSWAIPLPIKRMEVMHIYEQERRISFILNHNHLITNSITIRSIKINKKRLTHHQ